MPPRFRQGRRELAWTSSSCAPPCSEGAIVLPAQPVVNEIQLIARFLLTGRPRNTPRLPLESGGFRLLAGRPRLARVEHAGEPQVAPPLSPAHRVRSGRATP